MPRRRDDAEDRASAGRDEAWFANIKRTYDEYQDQAIKGSRLFHTHSKNLDLAALQAVQNAVENANNAAKQHLERINMQNTTTTENLNQQNDALFSVLVEKLRKEGTATISIS